MNLNIIEHPVFDLKINEYYDSSEGVIFNGQIDMESLDISPLFIRKLGRNFGLYGLFTLKNRLLTSLQQTVFIAEYKRKILDAVIMTEGEMVRMYELIKLDD